MSFPFVRYAVRICVERCADLFVPQRLAHYRQWDSVVQADRCTIEFDQPSKYRDLHGKCLVHIGGVCTLTSFKYVVFHTADTVSFILC